LEYSFPGNIRELKAIIELACVLCEQQVIAADDITYNNEKSINNIMSQEMTFDDYTNLIIKFYLEKYDDNVIIVAKKLNIGKSTIYRIVKTDSFQKLLKN